MNLLFLVLFVTCSTLYGVSFVEALHHWMRNELLPLALSCFLTTLAGVAAIELAMHIRW